MSNIQKLKDVVAALRKPDGCPWDQEQTHKSILSDLLEEAYEFMEAVESGDDHHMEEELGDLLLQVVFHSQIATEEERFTLEDVAGGIAEKLIRRHPHVFGDDQVEDTAEVLSNWEKIKQQEKGKEDRKSIIDGIPKQLPALHRAQKVQSKVSRFGFDWKEVTPALDKVEEEFAEFREALESGDMNHAEEELGDIIFSMVNVARHSGFSAEEALRRTTEKFISRFQNIEEQFGNDSDKIREASLEELDAAWEKSKERS